MMPSLFDAVSHCQKTVDGERDALEEHVIDYLTQIVVHLRKLQPTRELFPVTMIDVENHFLMLAKEEGAYSGHGMNDYILKLLSFVQREAAMAMTDFEKISRWIALKIPQLDTGLTSGVQEHVLQTIQSMKSQMSNILTKLPEYHYRRGECIAKFGQEATKETVEEENSSSGQKSKTMNTKMVVKELRENVNYLRFCVLHDVEWYIKLRLIVEEIRSAHFQVCDAITKNVKQIMDPKNRSTTMDRSRNPLKFDH
eukprot:Plantae.Rhodophyta-Purpureofilum_apyrenoidigerum.ctg6097.p1 GENE.Plantae.Rhodophyta-Purpureofilum_apyrenoidigerum.ctg6097~~Plantae.Rhodophyta-Purpureofilum_apyrenoidigerum.ctg6097.p1  ORF type:complete len:254 (-),score=60.53 Plantae.Rhodophyta-Purpureofilum_apyrenoidigerum.ctg6097:877-1638(-)